MKRLTEKEEAILQIVWKRKQAFAKEVRMDLPDPKPHINTISTTLKRMAEKGFLSYEDFGTTYRYFATVSKKDYTNRFVKPLLARLFGSSIKTAVAFFAEEEDISVQELNEIVAMVKQKKK
jgi:BlaI family transcriptional regulator, penicillinase repressor